MITDKRAWRQGLGFGQSGRELSGRRRPGLGFCRWLRGWRGGSPLVQLGPHTAQQHPVAVPWASLGPPWGLCLQEAGLAPL